MNQIESTTYVTKYSTSVLSEPIQPTCKLCNIKPSDDIILIHVMYY